MSLVLGRLLLELASLLLLDLLQGFQEELFDVTALIKDHLGHSFQVGRFLPLHPDALSQILQLLMLLPDNLLVLKLKQLTFFLEISHDLTQGFLH